MALAMGSGDVISDVTVTLRVPRGEQHALPCAMALRFGRDDGSNRSAIQDATESIRAALERRLLILVVSSQSKDLPFTMDRPT